MGTAYLFEYRDCGYSAQVCGGKDSGMETTLQTSVCGDCRALVDVAVGASWDEDHWVSAEDDPKLRRCPGCGGKSCHVGKVPVVSEMR